MDIQLKKRPWYIRYKYYLMAGAAFMAFMIYVVFLSMGPRKQRIDTDSIQIADVETNRFMEYVDVEGLVQPILTIQVNTKEGGSASGKVVTTGDANIRTGAGLDYKSVGVMPKGASAAYLNESKKDDRGVAWYRINYNGTTGWVSSKYAVLK